MNARMIAILAAVLIGMPAAGQVVPLRKLTVQKFVEAVIEANAVEIETSKLAAETSSSPIVKLFAARMVEDHTEAAAALSAAAKSEGISAPDIIDAKHQAKIDALKRADRNNFDRAYVDMQAKAHEEAVEVFKAYAIDGTPGAVRDFAIQQLRVIEGHLAEAKRMTM